MNGLPGADVVESGQRDLAAGRESVPSLLVSMAAPRLRTLGFDVPPPLPEPELALYRLLSERHGRGAHSKYNAWRRLMLSFLRAAACARR